MTPTPTVTSIYNVGGDEWYAIVRYGRRNLCMSIRERKVRQVAPERPIGAAGLALVRAAVREAWRSVRAAACAS